MVDFDILTLITGFIILGILFIILKFKFKKG